MGLEPTVTPGDPEPNPSHACATTGTFTVTLTVTNSSGSDSETRQITVDGGTTAGPGIYVPGAAHQGGAAGTNWRTDLEVYNLGSTQLSSPWSCSTATRPPPTRRRCRSTSPLAAASAMVT